MSAPRPALAEVYGKLRDLANTARQKNGIPEKKSTNADRDAKLVAQPPEQPRRQLRARDPHSLRDLHDAAYRFVRELTADPDAAAELQRRAEYVTTRTADGTSYARVKARAGAAWDRLPAFPAVSQRGLAAAELAKSRIDDDERAMRIYFASDLRTERRHLEDLLGEAVEPEEEETDDEPALTVDDDTRKVLQAWLHVVKKIEDEADDLAADGCRYLADLDGVGSVLRTGAAFFEPLPLEAVEAAATAMVAWQPGEPRDPKEVERFRRAGESYIWVCSERPDLAPTGKGRRYTREMWRYIVENGCPTYQDENEQDLPNPPYESWKRYVREYNRDSDAPKVTPQEGREHGSSIVKQDQI